MKRPQKLVAANWKMNPASLLEAEDLFLDSVEELQSVRGTAIVICPPAPFIAALRELYNGKRIALGAQDVFWEAQGSHTGEHSAGQLKSVGVTHVVIGHSERRARGETDEMVTKKIRAAIAVGLQCIVCIGERERDVHGDYLGVLRGQIHAVLAGISRTKVKHLHIAYEPIWAIGKSAEHALTPRDLHETTIFIRKVLREQFTKVVASAVPILYGGSVEPENAEALLADGEADGFLVGHASLKPTAFRDIVMAAQKVHKQQGSN